MGIIIKLEKDRSNYEEGRYSIVYKDNQSKYAIKIFKKNPSVDPMLCIVCPETVFSDEVKAYELIWGLATGDAENLRVLVPEYYGLCQVESIFDHEMRDISKDYNLKMNYKMELLEGKFTKINKKWANFLSGDTQYSRYGSKNRGYR